VKGTLESISGTMLQRRDRYFFQHSSIYRLLREVRSRLASTGSITDPTLSIRFETPDTPVIFYLL
jgi:hypothetical protein